MIKRRKLLHKPTIWGKDKCESASCLIKYLKKRKRKNRISSESRKRNRI